MRSKELFLNLVTGIAAACSVVVTSIVVFRQAHVPAATGAQATPTGQKNRVIVDWQRQVAEGRRMGPESAPLTVLYYGDFECPACRRFTKVVEDFRKMHPADLSVVFRHLPLSYHRFAYPSARAAECAADQGKFEPMYTALYTAQDSLGLVSYLEFARRAAVPDLRRFDACMKDTSAVARIERDRKAAMDASIPGTPGIIIGGKLFAEKIPSAADLEQLATAARRAKN